MAIYDHPVKALNGADASLGDYQGKARAQRERSPPSAV